jgi:nucleoside-diphosphate-sugar epimerase
VKTSMASAVNCRILITGGSGFIGTNAVEHWRTKRCAVMNLDIKPPMHPQHGEIWAQCDLLDRDKLDRIVTGFSPDYVIHLAARTDLKGRSLDSYRANTDGVGNLIDALSRCSSVKRVLFASSRMVCPIGYQPRDENDCNPPNFYGASKVRGERLVRAADSLGEWVIVRPTSIWGPWFDVPYKQFFLSIARGAYLHPAGRNPKKSFGYVGNTVCQFDALLAAAAEVVDKSTIYLCDYPPLDLRKWADLIRKCMGAPRIRAVPYGLLRAMALGGDLLDAAGIERVPLTSFRLANLVTEMRYDTAPLERICAPLSYTVEDAVNETVAWLKSELLS